MKVVREWDPRDGPRPYSEEWWERHDVRAALRAAVRSTRGLRREPK